MKPFLTGLVALAGFCFFQAAVALGQDAPFTIEISSASGTKRSPEVHEGAASRVGLAPNQVVQVKLQFSQSVASHPIALGVLDGGEIVGDSPVTLNATGSATFNYQASYSPGRHRIVFQTGGTDYWLEFYVLDTANPEKNPPRVRVVQ